MLDDRLRIYSDPPIDWLGQFLVRRGISANSLTWTGFCVGLLGALFIVLGYYYTALFFILFSRFFDGLDGSVARSSGGGTDYGGFLDIVLDFAFYGLIPCAFIFADPVNNALAGGFVLLTFYVNGASFLAFAMLAERRGLSEDTSGTQSHPHPKKHPKKHSKSIFWRVGFMEASETLIYFGLVCLLPDWFWLISYIFGCLVIWTTVIRFASARRELGGLGE